MLLVNRIRAIYILFAVVTITVGLLVHLRGTALAPAVRDATGDALWAAMVTWWAGVLAPAARPALRGAAAYAISVGVEASQLYHAPMIDAARATLVGKLILGSGFDPRDLAAYAVGVAGAVILDVALIARGRDPRTAK
jgi:hypothetical protein